MTPRVVVVTRKTDFELLLIEHATFEQARFFLKTRGQDISDIRARHDRFSFVLRRVNAAIPNDWRQTKLSREDIDRFLFEPDDIIVAVGQDGLVANVAKYLDGQRVIGVNPEPDRYDGVLVPVPVARATRPLLVSTSEGSADVEERTMVEACLDDGQRLLALNEVYLGHRTHQSSRYRIGHAANDELHSSSGVVVSTGTGATGWARSIHRSRKTAVTLPTPGERRLAFFVREAFPSMATGTAITDGDVREGEALRITSQMNGDGVIFGDGIESDRLSFGWGCHASVRVATERLHLVQPP